MLSRTIDRAILGEVLQLLPQGRDKELSYSGTILPLEGHSKTWTPKAFSLFFNKFRKENTRHC